MNPGALPSSIPFLFARQLFHPSEWPLHSSTVFFLGGFAGCDQIQLLSRVNILSRHSWSLHPPLPDLMCLKVVINSRTLFVYFYFSASLVISPFPWEVVFAKDQAKSKSLKGQVCHFRGNCPRKFQYRAVFYRKNPRTQGDWVIRFSFPHVSEQVEGKGCVTCHLLSFFLQRKHHIRAAFSSTDILQCNALTSKKEAGSRGQLSVWWSFIDSQ